MAAVYCGDEEARLAARCLSHLICVPMALFTITDLEVLDILAKAGTDMSADEIVQEMVDAKGLVVSNPKAAQSLDRVLRVLASHSILTSVSCAPRAVASSEAGVPQPHTVIKYGLTPMCKYLAKLDGEQAGLSLAPYALLQREKALMDCWPHLADAILTGSMPFASAHGGCSMYEYIQTADDGLSTAFNLAMSSHSRLLMGPLLEAYEGFGAVKTLVDVGGGIGFCVAKIVGKHPHIHGVNFDLPHVVRAAPPHLGVEHVGGDMFQSVPSGDAIFMKHILHTWDDAECHRILENCWRALPMTAPEGKVIVAEILVPPPTSPTVGTGGSDRLAYLLDLCMLTFTPRGKERTFAEFHSLALAAGFSRIKTACYVGAFHILELYK